jgi:hypothetical protein
MSFGRFLSAGRSVAPMQTGARRYRVNQERWLPEFGTLPSSEAQVPEMFGEPRWVSRSREIFRRWTGRSRPGATAG